MNIHIKDSVTRASALSRRSLLKAGAGLAIGVYIARSGRATSWPQSAPRPRFEATASTSDAGSGTRMWAWSRKPRRIGPSRSGVTRSGDAGMTERLTEVEMVG